MVQWVQLERHREEEDILKVQSLIGSVNNILKGLSSLLGSTEAHNYVRNGLIVVVTIRFRLPSGFKYVFLKG